jgi:hypothetical protein
MGPVRPEKKEEKKTQNWPSTTSLPWTMSIRRRVEIPGRDARDVQFFNLLYDYA